MREITLRRILKVVESGKFHNTRDSAHLCGLSPSAVLRCLKSAREQGLVIGPDQTWKVLDYGAFAHLRGKK